LFLTKSKPAASKSDKAAVVFAGAIHDSLSASQKPASGSAPAGIGFGVAGWRLMGTGPHPEDRRIQERRERL